jgi:hypothetical protein
VSHDESGTREEWHETVAKILASQDENLIVVSLDCHI